MATLEIQATYVSAYVFTVETDYTDELSVGRVVEIYHSLTKSYGEVKTTSYSAGTGLTTVTLKNKSEEVNSNLTRVKYHEDSYVHTHAHSGTLVGDGDPIPHANLTDAGSTSHDDIDTHIADVDAHHDEEHTIASHTDTGGTGTELDTLTDGSDADALHIHPLKLDATAQTEIDLNTAHKDGDGSDHADVLTNTTHSTGVGSDHADVATNTTHSTGDGSDHADVATNTSDIATLDTKIDSTSGTLQTAIDGLDNYDKWTYTVDGAGGEDIDTGEVLDFIGGDNITLVESGTREITISGSAGGSAGGLSWSVISTDKTAVDGNGYMINASGGDVLITTPDTPSEGDIFAVCDIYNKAESNTITVSGSDNIEGSADPLTIDINGSGFELAYADATRGWEIVNDISTTQSGSNDHGNLEGLGDDDHTLYLLASDATNRTTFASSWTDLTDTGDTTLHDHDGISENTSARHTAGSDTTLGTMTADIDMDDTYQVVGLQAPAAAGEALRQTTNITEADLEQLTDGSDTALHDHDGISENTSARHTAGSDTTLGTMTADIDMDDTYQVVGLQAPAAAGEALRQTTNITEADLEQLTDGSDTALHDHDGISENTSARHTQGTDTTLGTMTADIDMDNTYQVVGLQAPSASGEALRQTTNITELDLEELTDGSDTTLHDHDGISENSGARHAESHDIASHSDTSGTGGELDELTDGSETTLHSHAGGGGGSTTFSGLTDTPSGYDNEKYLRSTVDGTEWATVSGGAHTQGTDTTLGTMTEDIDMDDSYQVVGLQAPSAAGEALRQTTNITEADLEQLTDGSDTILHDHDGISENTSARHAEAHDIASHTWNADWMISYSNSSELVELTFNNDDGKFLMSNGEAALTWETVSTHTQGTDTALGTMAADIDMNDAYQVVNLQAPAAAGEALRATTNITELDLEQLTDGSDTILHDHDGISENTSARHTRLHTMTDTSDHGAGNWKLLYSDGSGEIQELALGDNNKSLTSTGATSAPDWTTVSGGSGGGGGLTWSLVATDTQAEIDNGYLINATGGDILITTPVSPDEGDSFAAVDAYNKATTNTITISGADNIEGSTPPLVIDVDGAGFTLVYADATRGWEIISEIGGNVISILDLSDTPSDYDDGKVLTSTASGTEWTTVSSHTQGTDTTLGTMTEDIDMDDSYQIVGLQAPAAAGEALRQTTNITEADLEQLTDGSATTLHTHSYGDMSDLSDDTTPQLGGDLDLNQFYIELDPTPTSDDTGSGEIATMQVDVNGTGVGAALHMHTDGNFELADADAAADMPCMAIALETGTGAKKVLLRGFIRNDGWNWTSIGQPVYVSTTAGAFTQTAPGTGDFVQRVGVATHADRIYFSPDFTVIEVT